ncbi:energy transducer TonB [Azospirillum baldaniorum]|uniref:energy transducer TonB n=1 Tax=Azospirillum baldaniorum TaxID=1064539 RepID=UPI0031F2DC12
MATFDPNDLPDGEERTAPALARWGGSLVVVLGAHALLALAALSWHVAMEEAPAAPPASAPAQAAPVVRNSNALPTWHGAVLGHLERYKRYPRIAQMRRQQGVPQVHITLDRQGRVLAVRLHKGSGFEALDEETIALVERASPLPAPPPDVAQDRMELVVPVQYFLR